jgi:hypothetical protein
MRNTSANQGAVFAKRAKLLDEMAERAEVRRVRALKLGNQREADGAKKTIEESQESARRLRAQISE